MHEPHKRRGAPAARPGAPSKCMLLSDEHENSNLAASEAQLKRRRQITAEPRLQGAEQVCEKQP